MSNDKPRFSRAIAEAVIEELLRGLSSKCLRIEAAGSYRRGRPTVGDVELVYVPRFEVEQLDLVTVGPVNQVDKVLEQWLCAGVLEKRRNSLGRAMWGELNKLAVHRESGIPVDLFATTEACWHNYLVCRTGPAESNVRIATAAKARGWEWNPYGPGFSRPPAGETLAARHDCMTEEEVFRFVGLPYLRPEARA